MGEKRRNSGLLFRAQLACRHARRRGPFCRVATFFTLELPIAIRHQATLACFKTFALASGGPARRDGAARWREIPRRNIIEYAGEAHDRT